MKQFIIRTSNFPTLSELTYEERGKLLTILMLSATDEPSSEQLDELRSLGTEFGLDRFLRQSLAPFKRDLDEDREKYEKIAARNRANGSKGGRPRKTQSVISKPIETQKTSYNGLSTINLNNKSISTPTLEEVIVEATKCCVSIEVATKFYYYYDAQGWEFNGRPILNWRSKLMEWKNNQTKFSNANTHTSNHTERGQQLAQATLVAIEASERGDTTQFDASVF